MIKLQQCLISHRIHRNIMRKMCKMESILKMRCLIFICAALLWLGRTDTQQIITINPIHKAAFIFNFSRISRSDTDLILQIQVLSEKRKLFSGNVTNLQSSTQDGLKRFQIFNWEQNSADISINILGNTTTQLISFDQLVAQDNIEQADMRHNILMLKQDISNYMLPFNLLSQKNSKIFMEESNFQTEEVDYKYQPFLQTFWNQHGSNQLLLQWLPYFSRCNYKTSTKIFLQDLIDPYFRPSYQLFQIEKICESYQSWLWGTSINCQQKIVKMQCILQELNVKSTKKKPWWMNTDKTLYYFLKQNAVNAFANSRASSTYLVQLSQNYYNSLVPLVYTPQFDLRSEIPNLFKLNLKVGSVSGSEQIQVLQATLQASIDSGLDLQKGVAQLTITVTYLTHSDSLSSYDKQIYSYFLIFIIASFSFVVLIKLILILFRINLHFVSICKLSFFPITKGYLMAFILSSVFLTIFFYISSSTSYGSININFDNNPSSNTWEAYAGRVGLSTFLTGYFLLSMGINQAFKVLTPDETKIILEDDMLEKKNIVNSIGGHTNEQDENEEDKQNFIIKNMNSHRKYLFLSVFCYCFFLIFVYETQLHFNAVGKFAFLLVGYPLLHKITISIYRHMIGKQLLYLSAILLSLQSLFDLIIVGDLQIWQTVLFYCVKLFSQNIISPALQILGELISIKIYNYLLSTPNSQGELPNLYRLLSSFRKEVESVVNECRYEKSLFYANLLNLRYAATLTRPFLLMIIFISIKYNFICRDLNRSQDELMKTYSILFCFIPIDVMAMLLGIKFFQTNFGLEITKCLQFNKFKFKKRKVKWINDSFVQSKCLQQFYREFQKFCFSSQLYIIVFVISFSIYTLMIGLKIILQVNFVSFVDPAMLVILIVIWFSGNIFSIIISFIVIKLKLYEKRQDGKIRAKLQNIQKILKKQNYSEFLQAQAVKNYFLIYRKNWIIQNLTKIFAKQDFIDNNYELLAKYQHYKSLLKKRQIEERKKIQRCKQQKLNQNSSISAKDKNIVVKLPGKSFEQLAKPLFYSWFYIAKQYAFLKSLIAHIKERKKKQSCEYCSMSIELQVIQKNEFAAIINQYRLLNVGRMFVESHFIQFYKSKQQYATVCIDCKDKKLYIEKKNLQLGGTQKNLLIKWMVIARSQLLHKNKTNKRKAKLLHKIAPIQ